MNKAFFKSVHDQFGSLSQSQVDGVNALISATQSLSLVHRAYVFATAWHETATRMQPIEEYGRGAGQAYGAPAGPYGHIYYGRGFAQLTWLRNYVVATIRGHAVNFLKSNEDLVKNPELMLVADISAAVMVDGMTNGWFTGKKLSDFTDYTSMRRVINGTDKALLIARYAHKFETAMRAGQLEASTAPIPAPTSPKTAPSQPAPLNPTPIGLLQAIINLILMLFSRKVRP